MPRRDLATLRAALARTSSREDLTRVAAEIARRAEASLGLSEDDARAIVRMTAVVARQTDDSAFLLYLRSGRLPDVIVLGASEMANVRGGRLAFTAARGIAPETVLDPWLRSPEHD